MDGSAIDAPTVRVFFRYFHLSLWVELPPTHAFFSYLTMAQPKEDTPLTAFPAAGYTICGSCVRIRTRRTAVAVTLALLGLVVLVKEGANLSLPAVMPAISDLNVDGDGDAIVASLPGLGTAFYAAGKLSQIFATHGMGAGAVLVWITCVGGALSSSLVAIGHPVSMTVGWCGVSFCVAHVWGAGTAVAAGWFETRELGRVFAFIGVAGALGGMLFSWLYGVIVDVPPEGHIWYLSFVMAAAALLVTGVLRLLLARDSAAKAGFAAPPPPPPPPAAAAAVAASDEQTPPSNGVDGLSVPGALGAMVCDVRVALLMVVGCGYAVSSGVVNAYMPLYATERLGASEKDAAHLLIFTMLGALVGGIGMGLARDGLSAAASVALTAAINLGSAAAAVAWLAYELNGGTWLGVRLLSFMVFVVSASIECSWNINLSVFTVRFAGARHASTLSGLMDLLCFAGKVPFMFVAGHLVNDGRYGIMLSLVVAALLVSHACIVVSMVLDLRMPPCPPPPAKGQYRAIGGKSER